jgi:DnaJ-class molecular chaperone
VKVAVPEGFELEDAEAGHLGLALPITLSQAIVGDKVGVSLPEGGRVNLTLPAGVQLPKRMRIPRRGMTTKEGRGHLYIRPYITPPPLPSDPAREVEFLELLSALDSYYPDHQGKSDTST